MAETPATTNTPKEPTAAERRAAEERAAERERQRADEQAAKALRLSVSPLPEE